MVYNCASDAEKLYQAVDPHRERSDFETGDTHIEVY